MTLRGKNIIVTGAAGGIGRAMVKLFVENGAFVWACARTPRTDSQEFFSSFGDRVEAVYFDLADETATTGAMKGIIKEKKTIHGLVNNAGTVSENRLFVMTPMNVIRQIFDVNFFSQVLITQWVAKAMMRSPESKHSIVNLSSIAALDGDPGQLEYVSSKAAIIGMTKKLSREFRSSGVNIRVNAVAPGVTETKMIAGMSDDFKRKALAASGAEQAGSPESIADIVMFLLSDRSDRINGQVIRADA